MRTCVEAQAVENLGFTSSRDPSRMTFRTGSVAHCTLHFSGFFMDYAHGGVDETWLARLNLNFLHAGETKEIFCGRCIRRVRGKKLEAWVRTNPDEAIRRNTLKFLVKYLGLLLAM